MSRMSRVCLAALSFRDDAAARLKCLPLARYEAVNRAQLLLTCCSHDALFPYPELGEGHKVGTGKGWNDDQVDENSQAISDNSDQPRRFLRPTTALTAIPGMGSGTLENWETEQRALAFAAAEQHPGSELRPKLPTAVIRDISLGLRSGQHMGA